MVRLRRESVTRSGSAALSSAVWVLEWAYNGGGDPVPDIDGIVAGLVGLVGYVDNAPAQAEEPAEEPAPAEPEDLGVEAVDASIEPQSEFEGAPEA